jgi:hypothetical protein
MQKEEMTIDQKKFIIERSDNATAIIGIQLTANLINESFELVICETIISNATSRINYEKSIAILQNIEDYPEEDRHKLSVEHYIICKKYSKQLEKEAELIKKTVNKSNEYLLNYMKDNNHISLTVKGKGTLYLKFQIWSKKLGEDASKEETDRRFIAAIEAAGYGEYVNQSVNILSFSSKLRSLDPDDKDLEVILEKIPDVEFEYTNDQGKKVKGKTKETIGASEVITLMVR